MLGDRRNRYETEGAGNDRKLFRIMTGQTIPLS